MASCDELLEEDICGGKMGQGNLGGRREQTISHNSKADNLVYGTVGTEIEMVVTTSRKVTSLSSTSRGS